jgi:hypothetical protein
MKDRLKKSTLKILSFEFLQGRKLIADLKQNKARRYVLAGEVSLAIHTNQGTLYVKTAPSFEFDGRSGPAIVDFYTPNLGTLCEKVCWFVHDCNGYGLDLSFSDTNILLYAMTRDLADYKAPKPSIIQLAVSVSKSWYGTPKKTDWCYKNIGKVSTIWEGKKC